MKIANTYGLHWRRTAAIVIPLVLSMHLQRMHFTPTNSFFFSRQRKVGMTRDNHQRGATTSGASHVCLFTGNATFSILFPHPRENARVHTIHVFSTESAPKRSRCEVCNGIICHVQRHTDRAMKFGSTGSDISRGRLGTVRRPIIRPGLELERASARPNSDAVFASNRFVAWPSQSFPFFDHQSR